MRLPLVTSRAERLLEHGIFTVSQLVSTPDVPDTIEQEFVQADDALKVRLQEHDAARLAALIALGTRDQKLEALDTAIRNLAHDVKIEVMHLFRSPLYRAFFPDGVGAVLAGPPAQRIDAARAILTKLDRAENEKIRAHADPIRAALSAFEEAVAAHAAAAVAEREAWTRLQSEKLCWLVSYRKAYNALKVHYASMPRKAERFFRRIHHARGGEQPQKPAAETQVGGATTTQS